uniref:Putative secreted protein n=1 Tax=Rhipicephalus microplus TaxID=6941 RepID=A0A6M2DCL8_RHIMP
MFCFFFFFFCVQVRFYCEAYLFHGEISQRSILRISLVLCNSSFPFTHDIYMRNAAVEDFGIPLHGALQNVPQSRYTGCYYFVSIKMQPRRPGWHP